MLICQKEKDSWKNKYEDSQSQAANLIAGYEDRLRQNEEEASQTIQTMGKLQDDITALSAKNAELLNDLTLSREECKALSSQCADYEAKILAFYKESSTSDQAPLSSHGETSGEESQPFETATGSISIEDRLKNLEVQMAALQGQLHTAGKNNVELQNPDDADQAQKPPSARNPDIVLLGDSIIKKVRLKVGKNLSVFKKAMPGAKPEAILNFVNDNSDFQKDPGLFLVHVGSNLMTSNKKGEVLNKWAVGQEIGKLADVIHKKYPNSKVLFSGILYRKNILDRDVADINDFICTLCSERGYVFVDPNAWIEQDCFAPDKLHLNQKGVNKLGGLFQRIIQREKDCFSTSTKNV